MAKGDGQGMLVLGAIVLALLFLARQRGEGIAPGEKVPVGYVYVESQGWMREDLAREAGLI